MSLTFEEMVNRINSQNDKQLQEHAQNLRNGNATCSQTIRFICPGKKAKIVILQFNPTNGHNFVRITTVSQSNNTYMFSANKVARKHVGFGIL